MAHYNYDNLIFPTPEKFEAMVKIIKNYNLAHDNDYVYYYKLTFKQNYSISTTMTNYVFNAGDSILFVKKKNNDLPTNPPKILGLYNDAVLEDRECNLIINNRTIIDKNVINQIIDNCDMVEITPPISQIIPRAKNEKYKKDLINTITTITVYYAKSQECSALMNRNVVKNYLERYDSIKEYETELNKIKIYSADKFQVETDKVLRKKLKELSHYYLTDFEVFKQLEFIASNAKREGILNQIKITKQDLIQNNIKLIPDYANSLDSYIEQTSELLTLYKNKYEKALEEMKSKQEEILNNKDLLEVEAYTKLPEELKQLNQFVIWKNIKGVKTVLNAYNGWFGSTNEETCWSNLDVALTAKETFQADGIGIVLTNGLMGIEIKNIYDNNNTIDPLAKKLIESINSYTEYTADKKGVRILCHANQPTNKSKFGKNIRWYSEDAFFDLTGIPYTTSQNNLPPKDITQPIIAKFFCDFMINPSLISVEPDDKWEFSCSNMPVISTIKSKNLTTNKKEKNDFGLNDEDLMIELRMKDKISDSNLIDYFYPTEEDYAKYQELLANNQIEEFKALWRVKKNQWTEAYKDSNWDKAALSFLQMLRLFTNDKYQMDRIFRKSYLMNYRFDELKGEKTYGQALIEQVLTRYTCPYEQGGKQ